MNTKTKVLEQRFPFLKEMDIENSEISVKKINKEVLESIG